MLVYYQYCKNCGVEYRYQASGGWVLDTPQELNSHENCPACKKIILDFDRQTRKALGEVLKISVVEYINTNEVDIDTLLEWENEANKESHDEYEKTLERLKKENPNQPHHLFPLMKRYYPTLYNQDLKEWGVTGYVSKKDRSRQYSYYYYPSKKEEAEIKVLVRLDCKTNGIIEYIKGKK